MSLPNLPAVEQVSGRLVKAIVGTDPSTDSLWLVEGGPTTGKSILLHRLAKSLEDSGLLPVLVSPSPGALDAGAVALVEIGTALEGRGRSNGRLQLLSDPTRRWSDKLLGIRTQLCSSNREIVVLCDEPFLWPARAEDDSHFATYAQDVVALLLGPLPCRRVVTGRVPSWVKPLKRETLESLCQPRSWLREGGSWASLSDAARGLWTRLGAKLHDFSPLMVRLLVALAALASVEGVAVLLPELKSRREISRHLARIFSDRGDLKPLRDLWAQLTLVRRPFSEDLLSFLGAGDLAELARDILKVCLLYKEGDSWVLHETLSSDAREQKWLSSRQLRKTHEKLAEYYAGHFRGSAAAVKDAPGEALLAEMEAFHHSMSAGAADCATRFRPFFVEQLDALGRVLSQGKKYKAAAEVFKRSIAWDDSDSYAHHYYAFNLDVLGLEPREVETHYRRAIELDRDSTWWRSRLVNFLITRGRTPDARVEWDHALDALKLPDPNADPSVYENLHLWVARLLLHRGQLDFAQAVLNGIPPEVREEHPGLRASSRRLRVLLEAKRNGAVFPLTEPYEQWWNGPHRCEQYGPNKKALSRWLAGRVDGVNEDGLDLFIGECPNLPGEQPIYGHLSISRRDFNRWTRDEKAERLTTGRFVEIAFYGKGEKADVIARVYREVEWEDPDLPRLFPDPSRYLKSFK